LLNPTATPRDITCTTTGQITVNGVPSSGYEFSLDNGGTGTYQASNIFSNVTAGFHDVYIRQLGVTNPCLFKLLAVFIQITIFQNSPLITVSNPLPTGGIYAIDVIDVNGCKASTSKTVVAIAPPVYTITSTNILCYGSNTGVIQFNLTNANGYTLMYSIDNG